MHLNATLVSILLPVSLAAACASGSSGPTAPAAPASRTAAAAPAPAAAADAHATTVANLIGVWQGKALGTPFGDFPFAIAFDREPSGAVHGRLDGGPGMYLDFRFHRDGARWLLTEAGALPDVGTQTHTLSPGAGNPTRWTTADPSVLVVELAIDGDALAMTTTLR